jgi:hypothetical protein
VTPSETPTETPSPTLTETPLPSNSVVQLISPAPVDLLYNAPGAATISIIARSLDGNVDTTLEVLDDNGNSIAFNDDHGSGQPGLSPPIRSSAA